MDFTLDDLPIGESEMLKSPSLLGQNPAGLLCLLIFLKTGNPNVWCKHSYTCNTFLSCVFCSSFETGSKLTICLRLVLNSRFYSLCLLSVTITDDYRYASPYLALLYFLHGLFPLLLCRGCLYLFWIILVQSSFYHIKMPMPTRFKLPLAW